METRSLYCVSHALPWKGSVILELALARVVAPSFACWVFGTHTKHKQHSIAKTVNHFSIAACCRFFSYHFQSEASTFKWLHCFPCQSVSLASKLSFLSKSASYCIVLRNAVANIMQTGETQIRSTEAEQKEDIPPPTATESSCVVLLGCQKWTTMFREDCLFKLVCLWWWSNKNSTYTNIIIIIAIITLLLTIAYRSRLLMCVWWIFDCINNAEASFGLWKLSFWGGTLSFG